MNTDRGSNPVTSIGLKVEPFDEHVEWLFHCGYNIFTLQRKVQTHDFMGSPLLGVFNLKPFILKGL